jgi:hemerythrin
VSEEFESFIRSQLKLLHSQVETLRGYLSDYEEKNRKLKKIMSEELIAALLFRFEKNEERMRKLDEKLDSMHIDIKDKFLKEIKEIRNDMSEAQLSKAISCLMAEKEIKVDSKPLDQLKKDYSVF